MALTVDTHGKGTGGTNGTHDETVTLNASATILVVSVACEPGITVTSVTWDQGGSNQAMESLGTLASSGAIRLSLYGLKSPTIGTKTLRVVYSATPSSGGENVYWISFIGADTSTGWRTVQSRTDANGTGPGLTDANWVSGDYEVHAAFVYATTIAFDAGETAQKDDNITGSTFSAGLSYKSSDGTVGCTDQATYCEMAIAVIPGSSGPGSGSDTSLVGVAESTSNLILVSIIEETS